MNRFIVPFLFKFLNFKPNPHLIKHLLIKFPKKLISNIIKIFFVKFKKIHFLKF